MCGRMTLTRSGSEIADYFALVVAEAAMSELNAGPLRARYNIAPSQEIATVVNEPDEGRVLRWKKWGLVPSWSKDPSAGGRLFNARSETAAEKPSFRTAWKRRRCLVVADGFYEWTPRTRGHQAFHFRPRDGTLMGFAGLFEEWHGEGGEVIESCTVLTTGANPDLEGVHHRMPVILAEKRFAAWLDPTSDPDRLKALMKPAPRRTLTRRAVSRLVNDARFDGPKCLSPTEPDEGAPEPKTRARPKTKSKARQGELFNPNGEGNQ